MFPGGIVILGTRCWRIACIALAGMFLESAGLGQHRIDATRVSRSQTDDQLREFLESYAEDSREQTRFFSAPVSLHGNGKEQRIVYLTGNAWCGSGGCTALVLAREESSYKLITKITIARLPIRVLTSTTNGWHDVAVVVQGGGIKRAYVAKLSFDGRTYPTNPTVAPAVPLKGKVAGKIVVPLTAEGSPIDEHSAPHGPPGGRLR